MATKTFELQDSSGNIYYPHTRSDVVYLEDGTTTLSAQLSDMEQEQSKFSEDANGKLLYNGAKVGATKASELTLEAIVGMTATDVQAGIAEAFQYANNGKTSIASVVGNVTGSNTHTEIANRIQTDKNTMATNITSKGISASGTEVLANLASKVGEISINSLGGKQYKTGTVSHVNGTAITITLPFIPRIISIDAYYALIKTYSAGFVILSNGGSASNWFSLSNNVLTISSSYSTGSITYYAWE